MATAQPRMRSSGEGNSSLSSVDAMNLASLLLMAE
eukprot:CAMPEP_0197924136 /NCGR_PEP_ID=MMETSP1439-20131203/95184_1 /TAXON_ID=66791 /ORGANISM="Gonyaulax spinifera, Strain CCMP409" /LENGTH=34 /DNA_ID= /DNA_START= /DNA_END= /DNA_ORIENTATION=